jgi:hypothetical protein
MTQTQVKSKTKVTLTSQDVCELFCPLDKSELEKLTQIINETQYPEPNELIYNAIQADYAEHIPLSESFYLQLKVFAMGELQKAIGLNPDEYRYIGCNDCFFGEAYFDFEDYALAVAEKLPKALKKHPSIQLSPLCLWFLKQINVTL